MHTNETQYYELPQYVGSDIINPLVDTNTAYQKIDTALHDIAEEAGQGTTDIAALQSKVGNASLDTTAQDLSGAVNELKNGADVLGLRVTQNETDISTLQTQMSTATSNITTLNTSVAGLQTEMASKASATALNNLTTKVGTGNLDTVAQNCVDAINEVKAAIPSGGGSASSISYDGTTSGLVATNVQDAIDEVDAKVDAIPAIDDANDVSYDNTASGLVATNVQNAIDELAGGIDTYEVVGTYSSAQQNIPYDFTGVKEVSIAMIDTSQSPAQILTTSTVPYSIWSTTYTNIGAFVPADTSKVAALKFVDNTKFDIATSANLGVYSALIMVKK